MQSKIYLTVILSVTEKRVSIFHATVSMTGSLSLQDALVEAYMSSPESLLGQSRRTILSKIYSVSRDIRPVSGGQLGFIGITSIPYVFVLRIKKNQNLVGVFTELTLTGTHFKVWFTQARDKWFCCCPFLGHCVEVGGDGLGRQGLFFMIYPQRLWWCWFKRFKSRT